MTLSKVRRIAVVAGGRPSYIKMAPVIRAMDDCPNIECVFVDAKQHFSENMRGIFFDELGLRKPDRSLNVGSPGRTQAQQTAEAMIQMEGLLAGLDVDSVMVHGDMNYALGCAIAAVKMHIPVIHNEAGLRSFDRRMPEEINRIMMDHISAAHLTTESSALENLNNEGIDGAVLVGTTLADSIKYVFGEIPKWVPQAEEYAVVTMHRPENVDGVGLAERISTLREINERIKIKLVVHPRTKERIAKSAGSLEWQDPLGYRDMLDLILRSSLVITDSGGLQEETTIMGIPCITWRTTTERPITCEIGTSILVSEDILSDVEMFLCDPPAGKIPTYWDGNASKRIVDILKRRENSA